jgi:hypothetical protein
MRAQDRKASVTGSTIQNSQRPEGAPELAGRTRSWQAGTRVALTCRQVSVFVKVALTVIPREAHRKICGSPQVRSSRCR